MIFGSSALEVIVGLCYVYFLVSLICSMSNEMISTLAGLRAETLRQGINQLLETAPVFMRTKEEKPVSLQEAFWNHPLIDKLGQPPSQKWKFLPLRLFWFHSKGTPSYIEPRTFVTVLLDLLPLKDNSDKPQTIIESLTAVRDTVATLSTGNQSTQLAGMLRSLLQTSGFDAKKLEQAAQWASELDKARQALHQVEKDNHQVELLSPSVEAQRNLIASLEKKVTLVETELATTLEALQKNLEAYYNELMGRIEGWYKRYVQMIIFGIAIVATVLLNADTLAIANRLANDPTRRQAILAQVERTITNGQETPSATQLETGGPAAQQPGIQNQSNVVPQSSAGNELTLDEVTDKLYSLSLLGWDNLPKETINGSQQIAWSQVNWFQKIVGLAMTVVATSLGAPFWFELLGHLVNIRLAGTRRKEMPQSAKFVPTQASAIEVASGPIRLTTVPTTNGIPDLLDPVTEG